MELLDQEEWFGGSAPVVQLFFIEPQRRKSEAFELLEQLARANRKETTHSYSLNKGNRDFH